MSLNSWRETAETIGMEFMKHIKKWTNLSLPPKHKDRKKDTEYCGW